MRKILIIPLMLVVGAVRIVFHIAAGLLFLPYAAVKEVADGAGSILKTLIKGERYVNKTKTDGLVGSVTSAVDQGKTARPGQGVPSVDGKPGPGVNNAPA